MTDAIIEAAARALKEDADIQLWGIVGHEDYYPHIVRCILAAVTPLIRAAALEEAAKVAEEWTGQILSPTIGDHYALLIRALKDHP